MISIYKQWIQIVEYFERHLGDTPMCSYSQNESGEVKCDKFGHFLDPAIFREKCLLCQRTILRTPIAAMLKRHY